MKKMVLSLAIIALSAALAPGVEARTRVAVGFSHGTPVYYYRPAYAYPLVVRSYSPYPL